MLSYLLTNQSLQQDSYYTLSQDLLKPLNFSKFDQDFLITKIVTKLRKKNFSSNRLFFLVIAFTKIPSSRLMEQLLLNIRKDGFDKLKFGCDQIGFKFLIRGRDGAKDKRKSKWILRKNKLQLQNFSKFLDCSKNLFHITSEGARNLKVIISF